MAKTYKDFWIECEFYPHSQESLELMKECAELSLAEKYIADQNFLMEHAAVLTAADGITAGYFSESVDDNALQVMMEKTEAKSKSIKAKIWKGLQKILGVFTSFFNKIGNVFDETTSGAQKIREKLGKLTLGEGDIKKMESIVKSCAEKAQNFVPMPNQPYLKKIKLNYQGSSQEFTNLKNWLAAGLSDTKVVAEVTLSESQKGESNIGALPAEVIKDALVSFALDGKGNLTGCLSNLTSSFADAKANGITIQVNTGSIKKNAKDLEKIKQKLDQMVQEMTDKANTTAAMATAATATLVGGKEAIKVDNASSAGVAQAANAAYTAINTTIGASMRIYTGLNAYRQSLVKELATWLKGRGDGDGSAADKTGAGEKLKNAASAAAAAASGAVQTAAAAAQSASKKNESNTEPPKTGEGKGSNENK